MARKFVAHDTTPLFESATSNKTLLELLWGDQVTVLSSSGARAKVRARGKTGFVSQSAIGDVPLLEVYFIDVGQGDGVLIRTPDGRHLLIDGGDQRARQPTGKNAADFVDWKFVKDYGLDGIHIDAMLASHNDADHYGGLADLLGADDEEELDAHHVTVDAFYHAGVAWWTNPANGKRWLGPTSPDKKFLTQLMGDRLQVQAALDGTSEPKLQGEWAQFMRRVTDAKTRSGTPTPIRRLSHNDAFVPGFDGSNGGVAIHVLAPVQTPVAGAPALRNYSSSAPGQNTNGNSLLLRLDYGRTRMLLTGDLNSKSQRALLDDYTGRRVEFQCDVAKGCHHGSEDVSYEFLSAMRPAVTIISSGDNEGHDHPRPNVVAASATTGYLQLAGDQLVTPLVYSTELARSISLGKPVKVTVAGETGSTVVPSHQLGSVTVDAKVTKVGDLNPTTVSRRMNATYVVAGLIYGLVNVRTDGSKILCAVMNEKDRTWQIKTFTSRF